MKKLLLLLLLWPSLVYGATYTGSTVPDLDTTTPDGSIEPVSILDDAQREAKKALVGTYYDWVKLTNKTGVALAIGDAVVIDSTNDSAVALDDTLSSQNQFLIAVQAIANNASGFFARGGVVLANTTGVITRGHYLWKSATTKVLADSATAMGATATPPVGSIGIALTAATANQATILMLTATTQPSVPTGTILLRDSGACDTGFTEVTTSRGRFLVGVPSAGTLAGTLGTLMTDLSDSSYTPAGVNAASAALAGHTHQLNIGQAGASPNETIYIASFGNGTTFTADTASSATFANDSSARAGTLTSSVSAGTPSAQVFTGTANATMRSTIAPYIQYRLCKKN